VTESNEKPVNEKGVPIKELKGNPIAYLAGSRAFALIPDDVAGLKAYVEGGGFLWVEAVDGAPDFDKAFRAAAKECGWELKLLDNTSPLMTGRMDPATGYNLTTGVEFKRALKVKKLGRKFAEFEGIYAGGKMVGVYSPLDVLFSLMPYEADNCLGYKSEDAAAVATNLVLYLTTLPATK